MIATKWKSTLFHYFLFISKQEQLISTERLANIANLWLHHLFELYFNQELLNSLCLILSKGPFTEFIVIVYKIFLKCCSTVSQLSGSLVRHIGTLGLLLTNQTWSQQQGLPALVGMAYPLLILVVTLDINWNLKPDKN